MMFGPLLPLLLLAVPVFVAVVVVLAGIVGMLLPSRTSVPLPRAVARPVTRPVVRPSVQLDDEVTRVFDRRAFAG